MKKKIILISIIILFSIINFLSATPLWDSEVREYFEAEGSTAGLDTWGNNWEGQSFKVGNNGSNTDFNMTEVSIKAFRGGGTPGTTIVEMRVVDEGTGQPTGSAIWSGSFDGDSITTDTSGIWINMSAGNVTLNASTPYALVMHNEGDGSNNMRWNYRDSSPMYGGWGYRIVSSNDGVSFTNTSTQSAGFRIYGLLTGESTQPNVTLISPENNTIISATGYNFTADFNITGSNLYNYSWTNATFRIWKDTEEFNFTSVNLTGNNTSYTLFVDDFSLDNYEWNVIASYENSTSSGYKEYDYNYSFSVGATLNSITYNNQSQETKSETFVANLSILEGSEISIINLVYNGTEYTISNITTSGNTVLLSKTIDVPLNINSTENQTNEFYFEFTYEGDTVQQTDAYEQNSSYIYLTQCDATYDTQVLNFTLFDETNQTEINASEYPITYETTFRYWLGSGGVYKNYSYQTLSNSTSNSFQFCIFPYNESLEFRADMDSVFSATDFSENNYYLRNSTLTNVSSDINLYLILSSLATKFYVTVQEGISAFPDATVTIAKYFVGEGGYKTVGIKETDTQGEFVAYLDLDEEYQFSVVRDGTLYRTLTKQASCAVSPCEITLQIDGEQGNVWEWYEGYYSNGTISNITFNPDTNIVTYTFLDVTGLASYFRLVVSQTSYNTTEGATICDKYSYSSSGTLTCNVTGLDGDFVAKGYISRSPEKLDAMITFVLNSLQDSLGYFGALLSIGIIITIVFGVGAVSRGNPSSIMLAFGLSVLVLKMMTILPLGWITVSVVCLGSFWLAYLTRT